MKLNLILNKKSPNSKLNFGFDPLPYLWTESSCMFNDSLLKVCTIEIAFYECYFSRKSHY